MYAAAHQNLSIAKFNFSTYARAYNSVMNQLRLHIQVWEYLRIVKMQQAESGYQLAALEQDSRVACVAGFRISHSLGWGRYLYVDDLVTDELQRSRGSGKTMLDWLITHARHHQCDELHLDFGVQRHQAHHLLSPPANGHRLLSFSSGSRVITGACCQFLGNVTKFLS